MLNPSDGADYERYGDGGSLIGWPFIAAVIAWLAALWIVDRFDTSDGLRDYIGVKLTLTAVLWLGLVVGGHQLMR